MVSISRNAASGVILGLRIGVPTVLAGSAWIEGGENTEKVWNYEPVAAGRTLPEALRYEAVSPRDDLIDH